MHLYQSSRTAAECSTARPWGIHPAFFGNRCPRCGFVARRTAARPKKQVQLAS